MPEMNDLQLIRSLKRKWILYSVLADIASAAGLAFLLSIVSGKIFSWPYWSAPLYFIIISVILFFIKRVWQVNDIQVAQLLNEKYPQLEESAELLLQPLPSLNLLERLQYNKTRRMLNAIASPLNIANKIITQACTFSLTLAAGLILYQVPFKRIADITVMHTGAATHIAKPEILLPQIAGAVVSINPPAYTRRPVQHQQLFNLQAAEGSLVDWQIKTNGEAKKVTFIFNDKLTINLQPAPNRLQWRTSRTIDSSGFYQVKMDDKISELYKIEVIKDLPPVVMLQSPKQYTTIDIGEPQQVTINTAISDDYGIDDTYIAATIASGSGEAVKFKEQKIALQGFTPGKMQYQLKQSITLPAMGMHPGDELYFYIQATDNHRQQTRSDIYIVHLPDTAQLMSLDGLANNLTLKPEYFRSERQIIIETEQLLKDKDTISLVAFKDKSNNLGIDQKLLRLRYGKFLGDETESGNNDTKELGDIANFSDADKVRDAYTDKHDNAEDASFYDAETKKQLRATLAEMWNAEIQLRTFSPQAALPFEYKALRLLKDLQQQSRAYVAKTNFKTAPLDLKKRLTGDVSKVDLPVLEKDIKPVPDLQAPVRYALAALEEIKTSGTNRNISLETLQQANLRLHEKAIQQPARYLNAVEAFKRIMNGLPGAGVLNGRDILTAEYGLQQLLSAPVLLPSAAKTTARQALSKQYFENLQKKQP